jgi:multiple sugar transport system ATP-binding protein
MASVEIKRVNKNYGKVEVLNDLTAEFRDGEFAVLVGPSGCGKSTLLRVIAGLELITEGEVLIGGKVVNDLPPKHRNVAMVFQSYALYPHMTVFGNMAFGLKLEGASKVDIKQRVHSVAKLLDLMELLDRYPRQLSGGQRQRVATGRAIVRNPQIYLFDEPLSNLDAILRAQMRTEIKALQQKLSTTTIYVTHDQVEAMTMADRIFVMRDGRFEQIGHPLYVYDNPINTYVASFIGSPAMNLLEGNLVQSGDTSWVETDSGARLPLPQFVAGETGKRIIYGIRPEHIMISDEPDEIMGKIRALEPTGAETLLFLNISDDELTVKVHDRHDFHPGQVISFQPELARVHLFDAESGERLE